MAFFIKSLNRRWSLYIVKNNKSAYAMHANSVMHIVDYVMGYFANGQIPMSPWALYLCTNGKKLMLGSEHVSSDEECPTPLLINQIEAMDSRWGGFKAGAIWFEDVETKKISRSAITNLVKWTGINISNRCSIILSTRKKHPFTLL